MDKQKRKDTPQTFRQKYWLSLVAVGYLLFCVGLTVFLFPQTYAGYEAFYPVILNSLPRAFFTLAFVMILQGYAVIMPILILWQLYRRRDYKLTGITIGVGFVGFMMSLVLLVSLWTGDIKIHHRTVINERVYYVGTENLFTRHYMNPRIYECDTFQIRCPQVELVWYPGAWNISDMPVTTTSEEIIIGRHVFRPN